MQCWTPSLTVEISKKKCQLLIKLDMCFLSQKRLFPHEKVVPTQHETLDSKKPQCVAATSALTALDFPQLLSKECLFQYFIHGVQILFSCDEDNAPKLLQYWSLL